MKNKKFLILLALIFIYTTGLFSQGKISGLVIDAKDLSPIKDAVVKITSKSDSTKRFGMNTDEKGYFVLENLKYGVYTAEISFIGFTNYTIKKIELTEAKPVINIDTIKLSTGQYKTDEILVEDEKPLMELNDDKKVFNVEKLSTTTGGTALDVLRKLPMVEVDADDNVSLRGSKNVMILIDNKPMKFASLKQLPADAIQNVEIITNPSAKYEAEGVTGILNIVLKKNENTGIGYNGYLFSGMRNNASYNLGFGTDLKKNKWSFFLNGGGGRYKYKNESTSEVDYYNPVSFLRSNSNGDGEGNYYWGGVGVEYQLNKEHNVGIESYLNFNKFNNNSINKNNNFTSDFILNSMYTNRYNGDGEWNNFSGSVYYNGKFDKLGKELNVDVSYNEAKNPVNSTQNAFYYDSLPSLVPDVQTLQINRTDGKNKNLRIQIDYTNPFNDKTKLEAGYKGIFRNNDNDFKSDTMNFNYNQMVNNENVTNHFKLTEFIDAVYGTFSHKINGFRFKLGLRIEHTHTKGELITNGTDFKKDYIDYFPTVSFSQKLGMSNEVQLSYSRRITRPMIYRLNPFVNRYNSKFISMGNPELSPEYTDSYELSYMFISNIVNVTPMAFYRYSKDVISNYSYTIDTNITVTTYRNFSSGYSYGMDFMVSSNALKWWNINSTFSFYKSKYESNVTSDYSGEEGFSWRANIRSSFVFDNLFNIELVWDYTGKKINASGSNVPMQSLDISLNKTFFNKKLTLGIRGEDIFKSRKWGGETNGIGVKTVNNYSWDSRGVFLTLNYNFGNSQDYYKKSKNTKRNENEKNDSNEEGNK